MAPKHRPASVLDLGIDIAVISAAISLSLLLAFVSFAFGRPLIPVSHETRIIFDVATEANVWTWFNVVLLVSGAYAHALAAFFRWRFRRGLSALWLTTSFVLAGLSLDDLAAFHERLHGLGVSWGGGEGLTHFAWIVPGAIIGAAIVGAFLLLALRLRGRTRAFLAGGSLCFIGSAVGIEAASAFVFSQEGYTLNYIQLYHVEELLEAIGASFLMGAGLADFPQPYRCLRHYICRAKRAS